jgi:predicted transcriptional regulator
MPLTVRIPDDLRERIDALRGDVPRERFIRRLLEAQLAVAEAKES